MIRPLETPCKIYFTTESSVKYFEENMHRWNDIGKIEIDDPTPNAKEAGYIKVVMIDKHLFNMGNVRLYFEDDWR